MKNTNKQEKSEYDIQAEKFLKQTKTEFSCKFLKYDKHFEDDDEKRDIYEITLKRGNRSYTFIFGQSVNNSGFRLINKNTGNEMKYAWMEDSRDIRSLTEYRTLLLKKFGELGSFGVKGYIQIVSPKEPTPYDVLCCLTKSDPETFDDFCADFGYNNDSIKALKIYENVCEEWHNIRMMYSDTEIEMLQEIQ